MTPSDDFKAQLKAGNIPEALALALNGAVDLKITTWVTSATDPQATAPGSRLRTRINTIEGKVDNEIGEQFIGNGPYRELQQFHIDQVAQGNEIIHSNLKSLQTLFDVVITMQKAQRRMAMPQSTLPLALEPASEAEPFLQTAQDNPNAGITKPLEVEELAPLTPLVEEAAPKEPLDVSGLTPLALGGVAATIVGLSSAPESEAEEDEDEDDDWDDSVLDLLESLPVGPSELEADASEVDEDWRDFIEEEPEAPKSNLDSHQDWDMTRDDFNPSPTLPEVAPPEDLGELIKDEPNAESSEGATSQTWEKFSFEDLQAAPEAALPTDARLPLEDEDWGDLVEDDTLSSASKPVPSLESLNLEAEDEWDDWAMESEPLQDSPLQRLEALDLDDDSDWDDFEENVDPFAPAPINLDLTSSLEDDADWDNFAADELEPYTGLLELDNNLRDLDLSGEFEGLTAGSESKQFPELNKPSEKDANDLMEVLFGDEPLETDTKKAIEEDLFADMQFEEFLATGKSAEDELKNTPEKSELDLGQSPSSEKVVPPPPSSHLPNQNN